MKSYIKFRENKTRGKNHRNGNKQPRDHTPLQWEHGHQVITDHTPLQWEHGHRVIPDHTPLHREHGHRVITDHTPLHREHGHQVITDHTPLHREHNTYYMTHLTKVSNNTQTGFDEILINALSYNRYLGSGDTLVRRSRIWLAVDELAQLVARDGCRFPQTAFVGVGVNNYI